MIQRCKGARGSEAGSYLRLIDFVHHSTLDLRVIKKKKKGAHVDVTARGPSSFAASFLLVLYSR